MFLLLCIMYDHYFTVPACLFVLFIVVCSVQASSASAAMFSLKTSVICFFFFKVYHMQLPIMITDINNEIIKSKIFSALIKK